MLEFSDEIHTVFYTLIYHISRPIRHTFFPEKVT